jgi:lycopene cyclase domain-containing protein
MFTSAMPLYFITYTALFWVPSIFFIVFLLKLFDGSLKKSFWLTSALMAFLSIIMEWLYLRFEVWSFSEKFDPLLGIWLGPAPVEEFVFWFGATPFCLALYLSYRKLLEKLHA